MAYRKKTSSRGGGRRGSYGKRVQRKAVGRKTGRGGRGVQTVRIVLDTVSTQQPATGLTVAPQSTPRGRAMF